MVIFLPMQRCKSRPRKSKDNCGDATNYQHWKNPSFKRNGESLYPFSTQRMRCDEAPACAITQANGVVLGRNAQKAWNEVKRFFVTAPALVFYKPSKSLKIQCDSSQRLMDAPKTTRRARHRLPHLNPMRPYAG